VNIFSNCDNLPKKTYEKKGEVALEGVANHLNS
jgi:hypothetical protein